MLPLGVVPLWHTLFMTANRRMWAVVIAILLATLSFGVWQTLHYEGGHGPFECTGAEVC